SACIVMLSWFWTGKISVWPACPATILHCYCFCSTHSAPSGSAATPHKTHHIPGFFERGRREQDSPRASFFNSCLRTWPSLPRTNEGEDTTSRSVNGPFAQ